MSETPLRVSVRRMVEFTLSGGDIAPASLSAMIEGGRAHRALQKTSQEAQSERALRWTGQCGGRLIEVSGRADMLWMAETPPRIDEIKLCAAERAPESPLEAHRMQAVCYGFMLCAEMDLPSVCVNVRYVTQEGDTCAAFAQTFTRAQAESAFFSMLAPWARWETAWAESRKARDLTLSALPFPYPAYRPGQREMAVQVFTAIAQKKRLFASLPTGTGKSAAALYPALKALGMGKTRQIFYLTARGTARQAALDTIARMQKDGLRIKYTVIVAKDICCPMASRRCHPDYCPRAKGYFDRERDGQRDIMPLDDWLPERVNDVCERYQLCPFEFTLSLCEYADVVICDYNYAFDPMVQIKRVFERGRRMTLLVDEAHNLPARARDMLSAALESERLVRLRRETGKLHGRKHALYAAFTGLINALRALEAPCETLPGALLESANRLADVLCDTLGDGQAAGCGELLADLFSFGMVSARLLEKPEDYRIMVASSGRERMLRLLCLNITDHLAACTKGMPGCVFFSATFSPLPAMQRLLGGGEQDACFSLPSPFPPERLLALTYAVNTRYNGRAATAGEIARCVLAMYSARAGKYIAFFPSYAYMDMVRGEMLSLRPDTPLNVQARGMGQEAREAFMERLRSDESPLLSLCVLGGVFSEGVDLPGLMLVGVAVVGVGLPQVNEETEALRAHYERTLGDGFAWAYRYPGMHKVLQAAGRVIRSESDAGVVLLLDSRYRESAYAGLLPPHYHVENAGSSDEIRARAQEFWRAYGNIG